MRTSLLVAAILVSLAGVAHADIPPAPGYVETCTAAIQAQPSDVCADCSAWHGAPTTCRDTLGASGHTMRCRTPGASAWTEVWCRPRTEADGPAPPPPAPPPPAPPATPTPAAAPAEPASSSSCAIAHRAQPALPALALVSVVALAIARRRTQR